MLKLYQFRVSARRRPTVFRAERTRRRVVVGIAQLLADALVSFSFVFQHGHFEAYADERCVGLLRRSIRRRLSSITGVPFEPIWHEPVESEAHALALLRYNAEQVPHHDLPEHPALFDGSYFQDMVGARSVVPGLSLRVAEAAPGLRLRQLHEWVGLPLVPILPATDAQVRALGIQRLTAAAALATAADPLLRGRHAAEVRAKRAVVHLARQVGIQTADVKWALSSTQRAVDVLRGRSADPAALHATRIRLSLEEAAIRQAWMTNGRQTMQGSSCGHLPREVRPPRGREPIGGNGPR